MSVNGGYITCGSQEIQTDVPIENVHALIKAAKAFDKDFLISVRKSG